MSGSARVLVRYWAAAKAAVGAPEETYDAPATLAGLLDAVRARHAGSPRVAEVLARCSYLVDETSPGTRALDDVELRGGAVVDVLPPFAGGSGGSGSRAGGTSRDRSPLALP